MVGRNYGLRRVFQLAEELEKRRGLLLSAFFALYAVVTYWSSRRKFMWNDELYTYYIARLPDMSDVWKALLTGGEQLPPLFYVITRLSVGFFGESKLGFRLPEMAGFAVMLLCLFIFVARRTSNIAGLLAALFPLITFAYFYAFEARPYGLVLGFAALALLCWQSATMNDRQRPFSVIALALSLAAALSSHYYGVFVVVPIALGESVRTLEKKKIDFPVWTACVLAASPLLLHLPLIEQARNYSGAFWSPPAWTNITGFYSNLLHMSVVPLLFLILLAGVYRAAKEHRAFEFNEAADKKTAPIYEMTAAAGFLLIPLICVVLAKTVTGAFTDRYALSAIIGLSVLFAFAAARLFDNRALPLAVWAFFAAFWFGFLVFNQSWKASTSTAAPESKILLLQRFESDLPVVAADPYTFIELEHYAAPELRARVKYLADPEIALRRLKHNSIERGLVDLIGPWFGMKVMDYRQYVDARPSFLLCGDPEFFSWIVPQLQEDGMKLELKEVKERTFVFLVTPADQPPNGRAFK